MTKTSLTEPVLTADMENEIMAIACHQAWHAYAVDRLSEHGSTWAGAPDDQKDSIRDGIKFFNTMITDLPGELSEVQVNHIVNDLAEAAHDNWCKYKRAAGWVYGGKKDPEKKTHPCLVPYSDLPAAQWKKDGIALRTYVNMRKFFLDQHQ